ncbi:alpha-L-fucosidase [Mucilaginibacter yixingensis]|uniref:alpha-L-fucosidase n=1 Tax=Mucilaginibacter yixingensis TaxID=1295612 RepID=A0A2T5J925_9SPHI|nr:alpha-L-fucosidase [Mucilaginibacter yixingensis]PTQ96583.1 alpha-L-fucosidase [Mucilaginibacter yixingensis]
MRKTLLLLTALSFNLLYALGQDTPQHDKAYTGPLNKVIGEAGNDTGFDMAPETTPKVVAAAVSSIKTKMPVGPFQPNWESLKANYKVPEWYKGAKFGLCMHWGLYSVPAYHNEWYEKHMYTDGGIGAWHAQHFGEQDKFGYKDFIPMFSAEKFDPEAWADLIQKSGARFFMPACQHHDGFALWDSQVTPFNAKQMGPKRDLIGELCKAVRKRGLKFGFTNHQIENFQFINPPQAMLDKMKAEQADLFDPKWASFYNVADRSDEACRKFLVGWFERNVELIDKYQPDMLWFDNGVDQRYLDPLKLMVAAYYYNSARKWGKEVSLNTKKAAFAPSGVNTATIGSVLDFEGKTPPGIRTGTWDVDTEIGSTWGYTSDMRVSNASAIVGRLIDIVSKNGTMMLNLSPKADGTIPQEQQQTLLGVGKWLAVNGDAVYDTHNWITFAEGGQDAPKIYFTVKGDALYAIILGKWPGESVTITSLAQDKAPEGKVTSVTMLGSKEKLKFTQEVAGLKINLPVAAPCDIAYTLKITGLKMNPATTTASGSPMN